MPETVSTYDRLLVSVTLEKREGACALFVQKTPDMFTNLPSARKTLLDHFLSYFLFSFLFLCGDFELIFFLVEIILESSLIVTSFARQWIIVVAFKASGHCAMGKIAGVFGAHSVQDHRRWGRLRQGLLGALA